MAALIGIPYSYISPIAYIKTNIEGTYNVLEAARNNDVSQVIVTSTSETYGSAQYIPINEKHPLVGQSPYSASKIAADQLALSYHKSYELPVKIVRPFNTYGPRQSARAIIPTVIMQMLLGKDIKIGNPEPSRDLTYVEDTCNGFLELYKSTNTMGQIVNIGNNKEIKVIDLVKLILELGDNSDCSINIGDNQRIRPAKSEVDRLLCDNSKIKEYTNWEPKTPLRVGLRNVIEWMKVNLDKYKDIYNV